MRYDRQIYFRKITPGTYDVSTGNYGADTIVDTSAYANITDTGTRSMTLIYGALKEGALTVRIPQQYAADFDYILIGSRRYKVDRRKRFFRGESFAVSEVQ